MSGECIKALNGFFKGLPILFVVTTVKKLFLHIFQTHNIILAYNNITNYSQSVANMCCNYHSTKDSYDHSTVSKCKFVEENAYTCH